MSKMATNVPAVFETEAKAFIRHHGPRYVTGLVNLIHFCVLPLQITCCIINLTCRFIERLESWLQKVEPISGATIAIPASPKSGSASTNVSPSQPAIPQRDVTNEKSDVATGGSDGVVEPEFPLLPFSKGFVLSCRKLLGSYKKIVDSL